MKTTSYPAASIGWTGLATLCLLYFFSFIDRSVLALLIDPVKASLHVSDLQIGLLIGPAFAILYGILGLPIAALADTGNRRRLIVGGVVLWGLCTLASSFVGIFWLFIALRIGLAVGEAVLTPAAYSLIGDWFPPRTRLFPATIYAWSGQLGGMLGVAATALLIRVVVEHHALDGVALFASFQRWQIIFVLLGGVTIMLGLFALLVLREPARITVTHDTQAGGLRDSLAYMLRNYRIYAGVILGGGLNTIVIAALGAWAPQLLKRNFGWKISEAGIAFGAVLACASAVGFLVLPRIVEYWRVKFGNSHTNINAAIFGSLSGNALLAVAAIAPSARSMLLLIGIGSAIITIAGLLPTASMPIIAPPRMRAVAAAANLLVASALALSLGPVLPPLFGALWFAGLGNRALAWGIFVCGMVVPLVTVPMLFLARRPFSAVLREQLDSRS